MKNALKHCCCKMSKINRLKKLRRRRIDFDNFCYSGKVDRELKRDVLLK